MGIDHDTFLSEIKRLRSHFGEKAFSEEKTRILWRRIGTIIHEHMVEFTDTLISTCRYAPTVVEAIELLKPITGDTLGPRHKESEFFPQGRGLTKCRMCSSTGYVSAKKEGVLNSYAFKCTCANGRNRVDRFDTWSKQFIDQGFVPMFMARDEKDRKNGIAPATGDIAPQPSPAKSVKKNVNELRHISCFV